jgi:hypothetical protein
MVTVKAADAEAAKKIGRGLDGFKMDETSEPIQMGAGEYLIFGEATPEFIARNSGAPSA